MKLSKLRGAEADWARQALATQAEIVYRVLSKAPKMTKGEIILGLRAVGYYFESWHVLAALKVLKDHQRVKQVAQNYQVIEK